MTGVYDELGLDKMEWKPEELEFVAECPCGDVFKILLDDLFYGEDIATCDSCSLVLQVNCTEDDLEPYEEFLPPEEEEGEEGGEGDDGDDEEKEEQEQEAQGGEGTGDDVGASPNRAPVDGTHTATAAVPQSGSGSTAEEDAETAPAAAPEMQPSPTARTGGAQASTDLAQPEADLLPLTEEDLAAVDGAAVLEAVLSSSAAGAGDGGATVT